MKDLAAEYVNNKEKKEDIVHSSGYAVAQNGEVMGVSSMQSFEQRRAIDANRKTIRKYSDSRLVAQAQANAPRARKYTAPEGETSGGRQPLFERRNLKPKNPGISR